MQLCALNEQGKWVFIDEAMRHQNYFCMECGGTLRVRGGHYKQDHFFHLQQEEHPCGQRGKSLEHLQVQRYLQENLGGVVILERPFKEVQRIADVVWEDEKIIFEVQCSPILAGEVAARNRDYAHCGYQVVWILHTKTFFQKKITAAEHFLLTHPHYFTNMDVGGAGDIFDCYAQLAKGYRHAISELHPIKLKVLKEKKRQKVPAILRQRFMRWPCYFQDDVLDQTLQGKLAHEADNEVPREFFLKRWYRRVFQIALEAACR